MSTDAYGDVIRTFDEPSAACQRRGQVGERQNFEWAKKLVNQARGTNPKLERRFDQLYLKRP